MSLSQFFSDGLPYLLGLLVLVFWILLLIRVLKNKYAPVRTVRAVVVDKYQAQPASKMPGFLARERYIVVFSAGEKRLAFSVSEFSFGGYKLKEQGMLTYRGSKLIDFQR